MGGNYRVPPIWQQLITNLSCNHRILTVISKDIIMITCGVNRRVSHAANSNFRLKFFLQLAWCSVHWGTLGSFCESLHHLSSTPVSKQNTQNRFPWQRGEPNLEHLEKSTVWPVNTHGHTHSQAQWQSLASTSRCCKCHYTVSFSICCFKERWQ